MFAMFILSLCSLRKDLNFREFEYHTRVITEQFYANAASYMVNEHKFNSQHAVELRHKFLSSIV